MAQTTYQAPLFFPARDAVSSQEYLLVINPDANIATDIRYFKNKVWEIAGDHPGHYAQPHISIYNFLGFQQKEQAIINALSAVSKNVKAAFVHLENFSCFEGSGTIYLTPRPKNYFSFLLRELYPTIFNCQGINRQSKIYSSTEPHIIIARGLKKDQFADAWSHFKDKSYRSSFLAESIVLLRKELLKNDQYDFVGEFRLK
ncbi:MAG TPA: 2'-5' RNA ligase family protein [Flavipsychrobacter sp.]|nr:2'-5' RNA ligase family protein [Flavipsychrobacter sp.]